MFRFLGNIWIKLIALALGLLLWIHVATEKIYNYEITLPLAEIVLKEQTALAEIPPDSVTVVVSATGKQLLREQWREQGLRVNASQFAPGRYDLVMTPDNTSLVNAENTTLEEIVLPSSLNLLIDVLQQKSVPVMPGLNAGADEGFTVRQLGAPEPSQVRISGPRSLLRGITSIATESKELTNLRTSRTVALKIDLPERYGLTVYPDSVMVSLEVVPVKTLVLESVPIVIYNNPHSDVIIDPSVLQIELTGPPDEVDRMRPQDIVASIDFNSLDADGNGTIKLDCPASFQIKRTSVKTARLIIR